LPIAIQLTSADLELERDIGAKSRSQRDLGRAEPRSGSMATATAEVLAPACFAPVIVIV